MSDKKLFEFKPRAVIKAGKGTMIMSLPYQWCKNHMIQPRDTLKVHMDEQGRLIITPPPVPPEPVTQPAAAPRPVVDEEEEQRYAEDLYGGEPKGEDGGTGL